MKFANFTYFLYFSQNRPFFIFLLHFLTKCEKKLVVLWRLTSDEQFVAKLTKLLSRLIDTYCSLLNHRPQIRLTLQVIVFAAYYLCSADSEATDFRCEWHRRLKTYDWNVRRRSYSRGKRPPERRQGRSSFFLSVILLKFSFLFQPADQNGVSVEKNGVEAEQQNGEVPAKRPSEG